MLEIKSCIQKSSAINFNTVYIRFLKNVCVIFLLFISFKSLSQDGVGIGTLSPHPSAVLDIVATTPKGILIPRLTTSEINTIGSPQEGLLVYDTDLDRFCFFNGSTWIMVNEMLRAAASQDIAHTGNINITGTISATNYGLNPSGNGPIPKGGIIMWSGTTPPSGWAFCDGTQNTPDLRGRFIVGYAPYSLAYDQPGDFSAGGTAPGKTGGTESVTLTVAEMPSHNHTFSKGGDRTLDIVPSHYIIESNPDHSGTYDAGMNYTGGNQPHENRPPYYVLAFIMKL
jgi:microcystin-dependent protein